LSPAVGDIQIDAKISFRLFPTARESSPAPLSSLGKSFLPSLQASHHQIKQVSFKFNPFVLGPLFAVFTRVGGERKKENPKSGRYCSSYYNGDF
jgi:hypothetical protein